MAADTTITAVRQPVIHTRQKWFDYPWIPRPYLRATTATAATSPIAQTARLSYHYGDIDNGDGMGMGEIEPLADLIGHYVRISRHPDTAAGEGIDLIPIWYGIITALADTPGYDDGAGSILGDQAFICRGLEFLLDRAVIDHSVIHSTETANQLQIIDRVLTFNYATDRRGLPDVGNRSPVKYAHITGDAVGDSFVFSDDADADVWTFADIAEYLIVRFAPGGFFLRGSPIIGKFANLDYSAGVFAPPRTVLEGLNLIFKRRRGHTWRAVVEINESATLSESVKVSVASCFPDAVTVGKVEIEPAAISVRVDPEHGGIRLSINESTDHRVGRIVVRGAPVLLLGTFAFADGDIETAWSAAAKTAYDAADPQDRGGDTYYNVYRTFVVTPEKIPGGPTANALIDPNIASTAAVFAAGKTFLPIIPLASDALDTGGPGEYRPMFVAGQYDDGNGNRWYMLDDVTLALATGRRAPMSYRTIDDQLGFHVNIAPNFGLALNHYTPGDPDKDDLVPTIDYESLIVTAAWHSDAVLHAEIDMPDAQAAGVAARVLRIDVPDAEFWYQLPNTVVNVADGAQVTGSTKGEILRDDRARLQAVAALAKAWYTRTRRVVKIHYDNLNYGVIPGWMLSSIDYATPIDVNTTITLISWDFTDATTRVETDFAELNYVSMAGRSGRTAVFADRGLGIPSPSAGPPMHTTRPAAILGLPAGSQFQALTIDSDGKWGADWIRAH